MKIRVGWLWMSILMLLIAVSLYMTYILIVRPSANSSLPTNNQNTLVNANNKITDEIALEDVFRPTQFIYYYQDKLELTSDHEILNKLNGQLTASFKDLAENGVFEQHEYEELVLRNSLAQLQFDTAVPFTIMTRYFEHVPDQLLNRTFSRIVYEREDQSNVYFIDDVSKEVYKAIRVFNDNGFLTSSYDQNKFFEFQSFVTKRGLTFVIDEPITVTQYTFVAEQLPTSYYIEILYADTSELKNRSDTKMNIYNDALSQLEIDRMTNVLSYFKNQPLDDAQTIEQLLNRTFAHYRKFEAWQHGISYLWGSSADDTVEYIRYLYNYPVFGANKEGVAKVSATKEGVSHIRLSISIAKTPLKVRDKAVKLVSGSEVVDMLLGKEINLATIEDIRIGYEWRISSENARLLEFVPKWFVKMDNRWQTIEAIASKSSHDEQTTNTNQHQRKEDEQ